MSLRRLFSLQAPERAFAPDLVRIQEQAPAPLPRLVIGAIAVLFLVLLGWACIGRLDIIAVAPGKLVPRSFLQIVQPFEAGIVRELLVREGDRVSAGQVLVRMDTSLSDADSRALTQELQLLGLELRRIDAELAGTPLRRLAADPADAFMQVEAKLRHNRQAYLDSLAEQQAQLARARQDLAAAAETKSALEKSLPVLIAQDEGWEKLAQEGYAGKLLAMERKRARIEGEGELAAQVHQVSAHRAAIEQAEQRIAQLRSTNQSKLQAERVEILAQHQKLEQEAAKQSHRHGLLELRAPQDGVIKDLATHTPGSVVQPATVLMTLVPAGDVILAEVWVDNEDAGFVRAGQRTRLKLTAYPFQKYGMIDGAVTHISPDASEADRGELDAGLEGQEKASALRYRALVSLSAPYLERAGTRHAVTPGMQVVSEIHLGTRTVLEYLLSPVQKTLSEAGRER